MNILLINVPSRRGKSGFDLPMGLLYVGAIIERCGHSAKIFDPYLEGVNLDNYDCKGYKMIDKLIKDYNPSVIGFGGIATSYGRTKTLSQYLKNKYPGILQIAGGFLYSVHELLLVNTKVEVVFHGESEITLPVFLKKLENRESFFDTPGISYLDNKVVIKNPDPRYLRNLDEIPLPAYHLIDIHKYLFTIGDRIEHLSAHIFSNDVNYFNTLKDIGNSKTYITIISSRGCTNKCSFCHRHNSGIRQHSVNYVIEHIRYLKTTYNIDGFYFGDELFNSSPDWVLGFCDALEKEKLDIFYIVGGARVDRMNEKVLRRLKTTGCLEINYGQESGSDTILKELNKCISVQKNKEITILTKKIGISCPVQIVIGSPGETNNTIDETIQFLKDVEAYNFSYNYLISLPGAPIWQLVIENHLIDNTEKYFDLVAEHGGSKLLINLTKIPDRICRGWIYHIRKELKIYYYKKMGLRLEYFYKALPYILSDKFIPLMPSPIFNFTKYILKRIKNILRNKRKDVKNQINR